MKRYCYFILQIFFILSVLGCQKGENEFDKYRTKAFNEAAYHNLRNFKTNLEAYYSDNYKYPDDFESTINMITIKAQNPNENDVFSNFAEKEPDKISISNEVNIFYIINKKENSYQICSHHEKGTKAFCTSSNQTKTFEINDVDILIQDIKTRYKSLDHIDGFYVFEEL